MPKFPMSKISVGDVALSYVDRGTGIPLLLVHGFPLDHSMWSHQIEELSSFGRVLAPDLRGFGQSGVTEGTVTMERFADDLAALLDAVGVGEPVVFCGLSMGGYIGWQFWKRHPSRLRALVLCDSRAAADSAEGARARRQSAEKVLSQGAQDLVETMVPKLFAESTRVEQPARVAALQQVMLANSPAGIAAALRGMAERPDMTPSLSQVRLPVLLICGEHDAITPPAEMRQVATALPESRYVEIAGAGHMSPWEQPAAVNAELQKLMQSL